MNCKHCGKELPNNAKYCPNCAEPVPKILSDKARVWAEKELEMKAKTRAAVNTKVFRASYIIGFTCPVFLAFVPNIKFGVCVLIWLGCSTVIPAVTFLFLIGHLHNESIIKWKQYCTDKTSICPMCGSHSIKIYRKGYNYNEAFFGNMFDIKGSKYTAGMNSNNAMCQCQNCGHNWNSGYDYRKL